MSKPPSKKVYPGRAKQEWAERTYFEERILLDDREGAADFLRGLARVGGKLTLERSQLNALADLLTTKRKKGRPRGPSQRAQAISMAVDCVRFDEHEWFEAHPGQLSIPRRERARLIDKVLEVDKKFEECWLFELFNIVEPITKAEIMRELHRGGSSRKNT
jgi:hypothetical protein